MHNCPLCQNKQYRVLYKFAPHKVVRCTKCNLVRTIGKQSVNYENYHRDEDYYRHEKQFKNIFRLRYKIISKFTKSGKILDIGASTGTMLDIFKENGWETFGIEPSQASKIASQKGHKIFTTTFEKAKLSDNYFDAVIMNHTLEHVENPLKVLEKINKILKSGGVALIDVPNFASLSSKILKSKWPYILPNEHTFHFTPQTLKKLFESQNFEVVFSDSRSGVYDYGNPILEFWQSLIGVKKRFFTNLFGLPGATISTLLNKGTSITVVGRKK